MLEIAVGAEPAVIVRRVDAHLAAEEAGPVLHPPQPGLDQRGELGEVAFGEVGQGSLEV